VTIGFKVAWGFEFPVHPGAGWYLTPTKDVRMPLFMLAVFYVGLFLILATPIAKKSQTVNLGLISALGREGTESGSNR
jgi:hypothetical protein